MTSDIGFELADAWSGTHPSLNCTATTLYDVADTPCPSNLVSQSCSACADSRASNILAGIIAAVGGSIMTIAAIVEPLLDRYQNSALDDSTPSSTNPHRSDSYMVPLLHLSSLQTPYNEFESPREPSNYAPARPLPVRRKDV